MQITFDPTDEKDLQFLKLFLGGETEKTEDRAPAAKPAAAKKAKAKKEEPEVVEGEVEDDEEDLMEQAVNKATKMVENGKSAAVKAALKTAGVRRVSELKTDDDIRVFLDAL